MVLKRKLKGFTIIETLVALLVIMLCFGIGGLIITQTIKSDNCAQHSRALLLIKEMRMNAKNSSVYMDDEFSKEGIRIKKTVNPFGSFQNLVQVNYSAYDNEAKKIMEISDIEMTDQ
ncbi:MAG: hypothetical protein V2A54_17475 [Bacteroidota bacterium]